MEVHSPESPVGQVQCVIYARTALEEPGHDRIADQLLASRECARQRGWNVVGEYTDRGVSGGTLKREGLARLLNGAKEGKFSVILVTGMERISRNQMDIHYFFQSMEFYGVRIFSSADDKFLGEGVAAFPASQRSSS
jgi:DNA invertase Pin-like site-specific DNA recombinase